MQAFDTASQIGGFLMPNDGITISFSANGGDCIRRFLKFVIAANGFAIPTSSARTICMRGRIPDTIHGQNEKVIKP